jgi:hypothetical protein
LFFLLKKSISSKIISFISQKEITYFKTHPFFIRLIQYELVEAAHCIQRLLREKLSEAEKRIKKVAKSRIKG